jgi:MerR family transcriptional regulator, light-induced transcriptional regulator
VDEEGLSAGAVARRLGIAVTTLRTWHQRYGLGPSHHEHGHHRRYDEADLARLAAMQRLTAQGMPAAEAARIAQVAGTGPGLPAGAAPGGDGPRARDGGGNVIGVGRAAAGARGLARAAMRLDGLTTRDLVATAVATHGVIHTWDDLLRPVFAGLGRRGTGTTSLIDVEHLLSRCVSEVFATVPRPPAGTPVRVLLACADEEQHSLALEALAAALAERAVACRNFGPRLPSTALCDAVRRTGPAMVVIWSQLAHTADDQQLVNLLRLTPRPPVIAAAGPGWSTDLPDGVWSPASLDEAVQLAVSLAAA